MSIPTSPSLPSPEGPPLAPPVKPAELPPMTEAELDSFRQMPRIDFVTTAGESNPLDDPTTEPLDVDEALRGVQAVHDRVESSATDDEPEVEKFDEDGEIIYPERALTREERVRAALEHKLFEGSSNMPIESRDSWAVDRFGIPTYYGVKNMKEDERPLSRAERIIRGIGSQIYLAQEDFKNTNKEGSRENKRALELLNELQSTGNDAQMRALFARKRGGRYYDIYTGKEMDQSDVLDAKKYWMMAPSELQAAIWYEITKVKSEKQFFMVLERGFELVNEAYLRSDSVVVRNFTRQGFAFSDEQIIGMWKGLGFMHKAQHLTFKHMNFGIDKDETSETYGRYVQTGCDIVEMITEMTTKFRSYEISGFSAVDASNLAKYAEWSLETSLKYEEQQQKVAEFRQLNPPNQETGQQAPLPRELTIISELDFKTSQYYLQRLGGLVRDLRYGGVPTGMSPEGADEKGDAAMERRAQQEIDIRQALAGVRRTSGSTVIVDSKTGKPEYVGGNTPRTGGASAVTSHWEKIGAYTDYALSDELYPNLKYSLDESSTAGELLDKYGPGTEDEETKAKLVIMGSSKPTNTEEDTHNSWYHDVRQARRRKKTAKRNR